MSRQGCISYTGARVFLTLGPKYGSPKRGTLVSISDELHDFMSREALVPGGGTIESSYPYRELCFDRNVGAFIPKLPDKVRGEFKELIMKFAPRGFEPR
jgi:hypothetical protein